MRAFIFMAALLSSVSAQAQSFDTSAGAAYKPVPPVVPAATYDHEDNASATCTAPGTDRYSVMVDDNGAGKTWRMTTDTRNCPQAGIDDPIWKSD